MRLGKTQRPLSHTRSLTVARDKEKSRVERLKRIPFSKALGWIHFSEEQKLAFSIRCVVPPISQCLGTGSPASRGF